MKTSNDNQEEKIEVNNQVLYDHKENEFKSMVIDNFIYDANLKVLGRYVDGFMESDNIIRIIENGSFINGQLNLKGIYYPPC
jgi:hypothetical protein